MRKGLLFVEFVEGGCFVKCFCSGNYITLLNGSCSIAIKMD